MKNLFTILSLAFTLSANANTVEEARALFAKRGESVSNAQQAADIYSKLASTATGTEKANLLLGEAEAIYYVGIKASSKNSKLALHERGYGVAEYANSLLKANNASNTELAISLYWYAANIGKWGEAKGILSSLKQWKQNMKPALLSLKDLDDSVQDYGVYRILGLGYIKVPGESNSDGLEFLAKAYSETLKTMNVDGEEIEISYHVNNTVFLLEGLRKTKKIEVAGIDYCDVYESAEILWEAAQEDDSVLEAYNPKLVPETKVEFTNFFAEKDNTEYFEDKCN